eukprot:Seg1734.1 transcript_id=Seg1734.1/GoldUCD/mRNA.D3Y31 product="Epidermal retinol dehydrogenase 2" protein_id=Seg1734.1/GoldUCD/D3Y31
MLALLIEFIQVNFIVWYQVCCSLLKLILPGKPKDVSGEIVLITGAGSGIGKLMALRFASLGSVVVCCDVNSVANEQTVDEIKEAGGEAHGYVFDCSNRDDVYSVAKKIKRDVGDVSILVNNAGIVSGKKFMDTPDDLIVKTFEVNTISHFWTTKAFLPAMLEKDHGHVVSIASAAGLAGVNGLCDYCASKFGAVGFQESLHMEMQALRTNIKTTVVCPFYINTGMFTGVKTRFPLLFPIMEADYAADQIMDAILHDKETLLMPRILHLCNILRCFLPYSSFVTLSEFFGFSQSMDQFTGRKKSD